MTAFLPPETRLAYRQAAMAVCLVVYGQKLVDCSIAKDGRTIASTIPTEALEAHTTACLASRMALDKVASDFGVDVEPAGTKPSHDDYFLEFILSFWSGMELLALTDTASQFIDQHWPSIVKIAYALLMDRTIDPIQYVADVVAKAK
jgi:hypothetical protein